jgi:hypothetical protein
MVSERQLQDVRFYADNPYERISRQPRSMEENDDDSTNELDMAEPIVGIHSEDYCLLSKYVLTHIKTAIFLPLLDLNACESMLRSGNFQLWMHCKVPKDLGVEVNEKISKSHPDTPRIETFNLPRTFAPHDP